MEREREEINKRNKREIQLWKVKKGFFREEDISPEPDFEKVIRFFFCFIFFFIFIHYFSSLENKNNRNRPRAKLTGSKKAIKTALKKAPTSRNAAPTLQIFDFGYLLGRK